MLGGRAGWRGPRRVSGEAVGALSSRRLAYGLCRQFFPQHVLLPSVRGLSEGDAWHAEQGLADFLGAFDVCDLEESFG